MPDAQATLQLVIEGRDLNASATLTGLGRAINGLFTNLARLGMANFGVQVLEDAFKSLTEDAIRSETVMAQTNAALASTHGIAGQTAESIHELADQLSRVTPYEDETVQSAENLLLTFTKIGSDIFPQATEAVLNMSTALGQDTKNSAIQLGKALQDPVMGATALRRVGVALTESQRDQIKAFMASGDIMSAQKIILQELQTEFGGSARAAGETFAGKMGILNTQLGNLKETAFTPLLAVAGAFATVLAGAAMTVDTAFKTLPNTINTVIGILGEYKLAVVLVAAGLLGVMLPAITATTIAWLAEAAAALTAAGATLGAWAAAAAPVVAIIVALGAAGVLLQKLWEANFGGIQEIVGNALNWLGEKISSYLDWYFGVINSVLGVFGQSIDWRAVWEGIKGGAAAGAQIVGSTAGSTLDSLGDLFKLKGVVAGQKLGEGINEGAAAVTQAINAALKDSQRLSEVIQQNMTVLQRENLELKKQEAGLQLAMLPLKSQEADLALQLNEAGNKRVELELQSVAAREKLLGLTSSQALEDLTYEQRRLQLKIQADALAGRGVSSSDVSRLVELSKAKPGVELAALEGGRGATLADRAVGRSQLETQIRSLPIQQQQAALQLEIAQRQREIDRLAEQKQAAQLANVPQIADLEARKRALEDQQFVAKQKLNDLDKTKTAGNIQLHIEQHIMANGEIDYERIINGTYQAVVDGLTQAQNTTPASANLALPGSRGPGQPS